MAMMSGGEVHTWVDGAWHAGDVKLAGAADHGFWQGNLVFDGARQFDGAAPDLDLHCARVNASARIMVMKPTHSDGELLEIAREGLSRFNGATPVYVRPMYWTRSGDRSIIGGDPDTTVFAMCLEAMPMADPAEMAGGGMRVTTTQFRRPMQTMMPTEAKTGALYPNNARMMREAQAKGFDNAVVQDALGNVAELASSNIFIVKDGVIATPMPNGTFLNGITRQRVIQLMRAAGHEVVEKVLTLQDVRDADEAFSTGNANKIVPIIAFDDREYGLGPVGAEVRMRYWDYAHGS